MEDGLTSGGGKSNDAKRDEEYYRLNVELFTKDYIMSYTDLEKYLYFLPGAALALSVSFIEKIAKLADAQWRPMLFVSWGLLLMSIISNLLSHQVGTQKKHKKRLNFIQKRDYDAADAADKSINSWNTFFNWTSVIFLLLGLVVMVIYCVRNSI